MNPETMRTPGCLRMAAERTAALAGLVALSPLLAVIAAAIAVETGFPVLFRQRRVGRGGTDFYLLKFRSMASGTKGPSITRSGDSRITGVGRFLRRYKLDEIPQLWNVVRGEMDLIGPRPEVPHYVDLSDPLWKAVLMTRPGISDLATLVYRNEEEALAAVPDPERFYRETILPDKLALNLRYMRRRSPASDFRLLFWTVRYSFAPAGFTPEKIRRLFQTSAPHNA
jgi:lipopolysaccharide/colanic/teichoic acid biosynthesis glycosyltransferase